MTAAWTDEAHEIVSHFTSHMPHGVRARYETKVREMLTMSVSQGDHDQVMQATKVCINVMWSMWDEARRESAGATLGGTIVPPSKPSIPGGEALNF